MYLRIYPEDLKTGAAIGDVSKVLVAGVNGTISLNNQEQYVSVGATAKEIKIALEKIGKFLQK